MAAHSSKIAHKAGPHHLSQHSLLKEGSASDGWVESLTSLTDSVQATQLLDEEAAQAAVSPSLLLAQLLHPRAFFWTQTAWQGRLSSRASL